MGTRASLASAAALGALVLIPTNPASAQVVLDPTFSSDTVSAGEYAPGQNTDYLIRESYGQRSGDNLFHRFSRFDVPTGQSATFIEDAPGSGIRRVVAHVGGNAASQIDGVLRSTIPNADLYFLNARGVVFGPNAQLDLMGSFHLSSADYLRFRDDVRFGTTETGAATTITSAEPAAWGFLSAGAGEIAVEGTRLVLPDQRDFSITGGPIRIEGPGTLGAPNIQTTSGRLSLLSVDSAGEVDPFGSNAPDLDVFAALGPVTLSNGAVIDASGSDDQVLIVRADSLSLDDATIHANHYGPGDHPGQAIDVSVRNAFRIGSQAMGTLGEVLSVTSRTGGGADVGNGGEIRIEAGTFVLEGDGTTFAAGSACDLGFGCTDATRPGGRGGDLEIDADEVRIRDGATLFTVNAGLGAGSDVRVRARRLEVGSGPGSPAETRILTAVTNDLVAAPADTPMGGDIIIEATEEVVFENFGALVTRTFSAAQGGDIQVTTGDLTMVDTDALDTNRSSIGTTTWGRGLTDPGGGEGRAGDVTLDATGDISLEGGFIRSAALFGNSPNPANGLPGAVTVRAPNGLVRLGTRSNITSALNDGIGVPISVTANAIELVDGGLIQSSISRDGRAGDVHLDAPTIRITGAPASSSPSSVSSTSVRNDAGTSSSSGSVVIDGTQLLLADGARIRVDGVIDGGAGNVLIGARAPLSSVVIDDASIEAVTTGEFASGGDIEINADQITLDHGARITASNVVIGGTGSIRLNGDVLNMRGGSEIAATSGVSGQGGSIDIRMTDRFLGDNARLTTDSNGSVPGNEGGNINLDAQVVILSETALRASAPSGAGGRIQIVAGRLLVTANNPAPDATGGSNLQDGVVEILASETNTANTIPRPAIVFEDPGRQLATGCDARTEAQGSLYLLPPPADRPPGEELALIPTASDPEQLAQRACGRL